MIQVKSEETSTVETFEGPAAVRFHLFADPELCSQMQPSEISQEITDNEATATSAVPTPVLPTDAATEGYISYISKTVYTTLASAIEPSVRVTSNSNSTAIPCEFETYSNDELKIYCYAKTMISILGILRLSQEGTHDAMGSTEAAPQEKVGENGRGRCQHRDAFRSFYQVLGLFYYPFLSTRAGFRRCSININFSSRGSPTISSGNFAARGAGDHEEANIG